MKNNEIVEQKVWTITLNKYEDGSERMVRENEGFNALELIGLCSKIKKEIFEQLEGKIIPDVVTRIVKKSRINK